MSISRLNRDQLTYLEQLKSLQANGVRIIIEDTEVSVDSWEDIFKLNDRGSTGSTICYMPDFIEGCKGRVDEVRLNRIYNRI